MMQTLRTAFLVASVVPTCVSAIVSACRRSSEVQDNREAATTTPRRSGPKRGKATFTIKSPSGISQLAIERTDDKWPDAVALRLRFTGLEFFQATNGKITLNASVSTQDRKVRLWKDGKEGTPLDAKSPYWMQFRMIGGDGKPSEAIPLKDGYFEMQLPKAFFEGNPKSITLDWIDFYRN